MEELTMKFKQAVCLDMFFFSGIKKQPANFQILCMHFNTCCGRYQSIIFFIDLCVL